MDLDRDQFKSYVTRVARATYTTRSFARSLLASQVLQRLQQERIIDPAAPDQLSMSRLAIDFAIDDLAREGVFLRESSSDLRIGEPATPTPTQAEIDDRLRRLKLATGTFAGPSLPDSAFDRDSLYGDGE